MKISVNDVAWLADELEDRIEAGYKWSVYECWGDDKEFQHVHFFYDRDKALEYCASAQGNYPVIRLEEAVVLQKLMENIYNSDKDRNDIDYYIIDDLSLVASKVLKINPDQNSLHDPDGNKFTEGLINHFETKSSENKIDRTTLLGPLIEIDLMKFPIIELDNRGTRNSLVRALGEEHLRMVTFEKTFVPAELIEEYLIVDQKPLDYIKPVHTLKVIDTFKDLEEAQNRFSNLADETRKAKDTSYLLLVGKYHNRKLELNADGDVKHNTGLMIDIDFTGVPSLSKDGSKYPVNPNEIITVREHMYGRYDLASTAMVYYDFSTLKMKTPDKEFWNREGVSLKKKQNEPESLERDGDSLLSKMRETNGKGIKR
jgi:hypothetical protein